MKNLISPRHSGLKIGTLRPPRFLRRSAIEGETVFLDFFGALKRAKLVNITPITRIYDNCVPGWWLSHPSEKYEFVSWDDDIPNIWKNKIHVPNHQPDTIAPIVFIGFRNQLTTWRPHLVWSMQKKSNRIAVYLKSLMYTDVYVFLKSPYRSYMWIIIPLRYKEHGIYPVDYNNLR